MASINQQNTGDNITPHELIYTTEEMKKGLSINPPQGQGFSFGEITQKTQEEIAEGLKQRQKYKDENDPLRGDVYKELRNAHRKDLSK